MNNLLKVQPQDQDATSKPPITGRIIDILQDTSGKASLIVIDVFQVAAVCHEMFGTPILKHRLNEKRVLVIPATVSILKGYLLLNSPDELDWKGHSFRVLY